MKHSPHFDLDWSPHFQFGNSNPFRSIPPSKGVRLISKSQLPASQKIMWLKSNRDWFSALQGRDALDLIRSVCRNCRGSEMLSDLFVNLGDQIVAKFAEVSDDYLIRHERVLKHVWAMSGWTASTLAVVDRISALWGMQCSMSLHTPKRWETLVEFWKNSIKSEQVNKKLYEPLLSVPDLEWITVPILEWFYKFEITVFNSLRLQSVILEFPEWKAIAVERGYIMPRIFYETHPELLFPTFRSVNWKRFSNLLWKVINHDISSGIFHKPLNPKTEFGLFNLNEICEKCVIDEYDKWQIIIRLFYEFDNGGLKKIIDDKDEAQLFMQLYSMGALTVTESRSFHSLLGVGKQSPIESHVFYINSQFNCMRLMSDAVREQLTTIYKLTHD